MLIALLAVLGVDLIVIVALATLVVARRRWLKRQPGVFTGAIRAATGDVRGLKHTWKRGYVRWVGDVLVWSKAPLMLRSVLVPVDALLSEHAASTGEVKRLGDSAVIVALAAGGATVDVAARADDRAHVIGRFAATSSPSTATPAVRL